MSSHGASGQRISTTLHGTRSVGQAKCSLGGLQASTSSVKEHHPKLCFEFCNMSPDGGLARLKMPRSRKKTSLFKDGEK
jgi:hypothetical protein